MPYCERGSATKLVGAIGEDEAWRFLYDVAAGLAYLHEQKSPVIHQDIKTDNVLMDKSGHYLITDFGVSTKARSTLRKSVGNTAGAGTLAYMAPERFGKDNSPIKASDVWALGATLYELMTGDTPFGEHGGLIQKSGAEIPNITGNYSPVLKRITEMCLALETWNRPTTKQLVEWTEKHKRGEQIFNDDPPLESEFTRKQGVTKLSVTDTLPTPKSSPPPSFDNDQSFAITILQQILMAVYCFVKCCSKQYADFKGRATRKEFWYFALINGLLILLIFQIGQGMDIKEGDTFLTVFYSLVFFLPSLAVSIRRLHDADKSGWWLLINFIPIIGSIIFLTFMCLPSNEIQKINSMTSVEAIKWFRKAFDKMKRKTRKFE
jgi:serine/threonine protein kinase